MRSKTVLFLSVALVGLFTGVAASERHEVILVDDVGATKVEKAVSMENVCSQLIIRNVDRVEALALSFVDEQPVFTDPSAIAPEEVFSINPENSAYRVRPPTLGNVNPLTGYQPPAISVEKSGKIYLENRCIRQCLSRADA
jgi:hypothetical protein